MANFFETQCICLRRNPGRILAELSIQEPLCYHNYQQLTFRPIIRPPCVCQRLFYFAAELFLTRGIWFSTFFAPVTWNLTRWPSYAYELDPYSLTIIYRICKYEFPMSRLSEVIVWQADRHTRPKLYTTPLAGVQKYEYVINSERYTPAAYCSALRRVLSPAARRQRHLHGCRERGDDGCAAKTWRKVPRVAERRSIAKRRRRPKRTDRPALVS